MKLSYSVVLYNQLPADIRKLYRNIVETVPRGASYHIFFINNSPKNYDINVILHEFEKNDQHFTAIFPLVNRGFGAGHNLAVKQLDSEYHFIVNPDVKIPNAEQISQMIGYMQVNKVVLLNPRIVGSDGQTQKLVKRRPTVFDLALRFVGGWAFPKRQAQFVYDGHYDQAHEAEVVSGSFMVCQTAALQQVNGFDERFFLYMEDTDLSRKMSELGTVAYYPNAYIVHEWQRQNRRSVKGILQMLNSMRKYFNKWGWRFV